MNAEKCTLYALQIIKADREKLLLSLPFFARALYALEPVPCTGLPCSGTNGERYFFDSRQLVEYFLSEENDTSLMYLHSVLHCSTCISSSHRSTRISCSGIWLQTSASLIYATP